MMTLSAGDTKISFCHVVSLGLLGAGILLLIFPVDFLSYYTYPIIAWGALGLLDALGAWRWKTSLMGEDRRLFWGSIVPVSILFWLFFEFLNLFYPQWHYVNIPTSKGTGTLMAVLSFSTVIPLIMESLWLLAGPVRTFPTFPALLRLAQRYQWLFPLVGILLLGIFFLELSFWFMQVMWIVPFFVFFPFVPLTAAASSKAVSFMITVAGAAVLSGFLWEIANFWAATRWEYLLLPEMPHLFEMPLLGYLGYIPFAFGVFTIYLWTRTQLDYSLWKTIILYTLALIAAWLFILGYLDVFQP